KWFGTQTLQSLGRNLVGWIEQESPSVAGNGLGLAAGGVMYEPERTVGGVIRRIETDRLVEVGNGPVVQAFGRECSAAIEVAPGIGRIEADRLAVVGNRAVDLVGRSIGGAPIVECSHASRGVLRAVFDDARAGLDWSTGVSVAAVAQVLVAGRRCCAA